MQYCSRCVYPGNHPLNIVFREDGLCSGCLVHEEKAQLGWVDRFRRLKQIVDEYKQVGANKLADCIVPVTGSRDSYFIVDTVKRRLGLRPLLVTYNKHYNTQAGIRNLSYLKTIFGCDLLTMTSNPDTVKRITKETLKKRGSIYWHCIAGQTVFPVQIATRFRIPLIIWGAHQGLDQVGMFSHLDEVEMSRKYRKEHDLMNLEAEDLLKDTDLTEAELQDYFYPEEAVIEKNGVRGIYLGNFVRWDTKLQHEKMIANYGYETREQARTFDNYSDVDCWHYSSLHDYIKYLKWGYGKVSDQVSREIRLGRLTREEGIDLVDKYQAIKPGELALFLDWLGISEAELFSNIDKFRDRRIWNKRGADWKLIDSVVNHKNQNGVEDLRLPVEDSCTFLENSRSANLEKENLHSYTLLGRGWVDS